ncbi:hypothetical protein OBE_09859, partial [human gut metagenome]
TASPGLNGGFVSFFGPDPINLLGVIILTSLGTGDFLRWYISSIR